MTANDEVNMTVRTLTCQVETVEDLTPDVFRVVLEGLNVRLARQPRGILLIQK